MKNLNLKRTKNNFYRIIGIIGFLLLSLNLLLHFLQIRVYDHFFDVFLNFVSLSFFLVIIIFPHKIEFLSIISFIYSAQILIAEENVFMGIAMFHLGLSSLYTRGLLLHKTILKLTAFMLFYISLIVTHLLLYKTSISLYLINHIGMNLVICLSEFFIITYPPKIKGTDFVLNLKDFPPLTNRDAQWLLMIQNHRSYKDIAREYNLKEGTVRNRMNFVYKILECDDKLGFMNTYGEYKIFFE